MPAAAIKPLSPPYQITGDRPKVEEDEEGNTKEVKEVDLFVQSAEVLKKYMNQLLEISDADGILDKAEERDILRKGLTVFDDLITITDLIPNHWDNNAENYSKFLAHLVTKIKSLRQGDVTLMPGRWGSTEGPNIHKVLYIVECTKKETFRFSVVNNGPWSHNGIEYHPQQVLPEDPTKVEHKIILTAKDVPKLTMTDTAFWFMLYKHESFIDTKLVVNSGVSSMPQPPKVVYETLMPYLNNKPYSSIYNDSENDRTNLWLLLPMLGDKTGFMIISQTYYYILRRLGFTTSQSRKAQVFLRYSLIREAKTLLEEKNSLNGGDGIVLVNAAKQLTALAGKSQNAPAFHSMSCADLTPKPQAFM